jgi:integrase
MLSRNKPSYTLIVMKTKSKRKPTPRRPKGTGGLVRRGNLWFGRIRKSGDLVYTDGYSDSAAAERALDKLFATGVNPRFILTLDEYWRQLAEPGGEFEHEYDAATRNLYDTCRAGYFATEDENAKRIGYSLGCTRLDQIRRNDVQRAINRLYSVLAPATVRRYGSCLRSVLGHAVEAGILSPRMESGQFLPANPADGIKYRAIPPSEAYIFSDEELYSLPEALHAFSPRLSAMTTVLFDTGVRPGELCAMDAKDITVDGVWMIGNTRKRSGELKGSTKTNRVRAIQLSHDARSAIALHGAASGPVWVTREGKPINPGWFGCQLRRFRASLQKKWDSEAKQSGGVAPKVPVLNARNCRKTFATRGVESGDLKGTQAALGHSTAEMTLNVYAQSRPGAQSSLIEKLSPNRAFFADKDKDRDSA